MVKADEFNKAVEAVQHEADERPSPKPLKKGTLVTGFTSAGPRIFGLHFHKGHLFQIVATKRNVQWSNAGYTQTVRCIVDDQEIAAVDGEFLQEVATNKDKLTCLELVRAQQATLAQADKDLVRRLP